MEESIAPAFSAADACLTVAFDTARREGFPHPAPEVPAGSDGPCHGEDWVSYLTDQRDRVRQCINAVLSNMIPQIEARARSDPGAEVDPDRIRARDRAIHAQLLGACPGMPEAPPAPS